ncbi:TRAFAC clade GTPase domain-containing protein [Caballeronia cordobensis]|nr:hypothetical protein [Caballeronia cordobensis]
MKRKLVIAGMPESGKSTFIAALRHLLVHQDVRTKLVATRLSDAEGHLNRLEQEWIACEMVERTKQTVEEWVSLFVKQVDGSQEAVLMVPDFSGEAFRRPAATGHCSEAVASMLQEIDGMLLFTNADRGADDIRLEQFGELLDEAIEASKDLVEGEPVGVKESVNEDVVPFEPLNMPEEPLLVEILQILNRPPRAPRKRMLAIIVSAWDEVQDNRAEPEEWLRQHRPMLWQYLRSNTTLWESRVYGVSAQGGRLPQDKVALQCTIPGQRVQIVGHQAQPHDLTDPIDWLMANTE